MTRRYMTGWESGSPLQCSVAGAGAAASAAQKRTGNYSLYLAQNSGTYFVHLDTGVAAAELYLRFGLYVSLPLAAAGHVLTIWADDGTQQLAWWMATNGVMSVYKGLTTGTLLGSTAAYPSGAWHCLEMWYKPEENPNGRVTVKQDGAVVLDFTGDTNMVASPNARSVRFGNSGAVGTGGYGVVGYYDDIAINDTQGAVNNSWVGLGGIQAIIPSGAGAHTDLTPSAGANYQCVDEQPPNDADYVSSPDVNDIDSYAMTDLVGSGTITAVCPWIRAKSNQAGASSVAPFYHIGGVDYERTIQGFDVDWVYLKQIEETSPATGVAWTVPEVNGMELGVQVE